MYKTRMRTVDDVTGEILDLAAAHFGVVRATIGATDWADKPGGVQPARVALPGPKPEFFFVPNYLMRRLKEEPGLGAAMVADMRAFYAASRAFVTVRRLTGGREIVAAWQRLAAGDVPPDEGLVASL